MKKTIQVKKIRKLANEVLANGIDNPEFRKGISFLLEKILFETGNYQGYRYLREDEVPEGQSPGVKFTPRAYFEETRISYL